MNGVLLQKTVHAENAPPLASVNKFEKPLKSVVSQQVSSLGVVESDCSQR